MSDKQVAQFPPIDGTAGEFYTAIIDVIALYDGRITYAGAIGAIEIAKKVVMDRQNTEVSDE